MKKKHKKRPAAGATDLARRVLDSLRKGNTREAVELAKQFVRSEPGPGSEAILSDAYVARVESLLRNGMQKEARSLADLVAERHPALRERFIVLAEQLELSGGGLDPLLKRIAQAEPAARRDLERQLTPWLSDPSALAASALLLADDPLRRAAGIVAELFRAATSGPVVAGSLTALDVIPRHSPLAPWKLLIRAIEAFHRGADALAKANLDAIPAEVPAARVRQALEQLMKGEGSHGLSPAGKALRGAIGGERDEIVSAIRELEEMFHGRPITGAAGAIRRIAAGFRNHPDRRVAIATLFRIGFMHLLGPAHLMPAVGLGPNDTEGLRLAALAVEQIEPQGAIGMWDAFLDQALREGSIAHGWEAATVLLRMAQLIPSQDDDFDDSLDDDPFDEPEWAGGRRGLLERALAESRDSRVYRALVRDDPDGARRWAQQWRREQPDEVEPLLHLLDAEEREGRYAAALDLAEEAAAIDPASPELRTRKTRLTFRSAEEALGGLALQRAGELLAKLETNRGQLGDSAVWLDALRIAATEHEQERNGLADNLHAATGSVLLADVLLNELRSRFKTFIPGRALAFVPAESLRVIVWLFALGERWGVRIALPPGLVPSAVEAIGNASTAELIGLAAGSLRVGERALGWDAVSEGLRREEAVAARFLSIRGELLFATREKDRARRCLLAARELARSYREMDRVREITAAIQRLTCGRRGDAHGDAHDEGRFDASMARGVLREEQRRRAAPSPIARRAPRHRKNPAEGNLSLFS